MEIVEAARVIWNLQWLNASLVVVSLGTIVFLNLNLRRKKLKLPPGPVAVPIFGNWLQVGDDLNHKNLSEMANKYGDIFLLRMGQRNLVVVSSPELARDVLHTQGVEFGSRTRNVVFDIFTNKGQDMVFTVYGDHWRRMRRIMTLPFFTSKVVQQSRVAWEDEVEEVVKDLTANPNSFATSHGVVIRRRLQMMMYNIMYRMMFGTRFQCEDDPLFEEAQVLERRTQSFSLEF